MPTNSRLLPPLILVITAVILSACDNTPPPPLAATDVEINTALPGSTMGVAYLTLKNNSAESINISRVSSEQFGRVEIHESTLENGIAKMRRLTALTIPAGAAVTLQRGGKHLMLMRPVATSPTSASQSVSLHFFQSDTLLLSLETRSDDKSTTNKQSN